MTLIATDIQRGRDNSNHPPPLSPLFFQARWPQPAGTQGSRWMAVVAVMAVSRGIQCPFSVTLDTSSKGTTKSPVYKWITDTTGSPAPLSA